MPDHYDIIQAGPYRGFAGNREQQLADMRARRELARTPRTVSSRGGEEESPARRAARERVFGSDPGRGGNFPFAGTAALLAESAHGLTPETFVMPQAGGGRQAAALGLIAAPQAPIMSEGEALPTEAFPQIPTSVQVPVSFIDEPGTIRTEGAEGFPNLFTQMPTGVFGTGRPTMPDVGTDALMQTLMSDPVIQQFLALVASGAFSTLVQPPAAQ